MEDRFNYKGVTYYCGATTPLGGARMEGDEGKVKEEQQDVEMSVEVDLKRKFEDSTEEQELQLGDNKIIVPITEPQVGYINKKTGLCYDVRMRYHAKIFTSYYEYIDPHPEDPRRIYRVYKILAENGLINDPQLVGRQDIGSLMMKIPVREATAEEILLVHSEEQLKYIASTETMSKEELLELTEKGDSIYFNHDSYLSSKLSCGGAIEVCKAVVEGKVKNAFAVIRPPGHHAEPDLPGGFCLFSNVAVAAKNILKNYPESVRRIVIVDWDVHHGNGTQKAFIDDPRVLYISLHRFELGKYYPGTLAGAADKVGEGAGEGYNINIPWPAPGMDDGDYLYAFNKVIMPVCHEFNPDLVIISAGFDAADGDVIGGCHVSPAGYGHMTYLLKSLLKGRLCSVMEGGYNLDSIAKSALAVAKVLIGESPDELWKKLPKAIAVETIDEVIRIQSRYWRSLRPGYLGTAVPKLLTNEQPLVPEALVHDTIRSYQAKRLFEKHNFISLPIFSALKLESPSLEDQVMCTPDIYDASTIVISIHDPAEVWAQRDPVTGLLDPANSIVLDPSAKLIKWSLDQKFGFIDINIPSSITGDDEVNYNNINTAQDVLLAIWDNYIQYFKVSKVVFVGFGDAYNGIIHLLGHREVKSIVKAAINFVNKTTQLRPIVSAIDESVTDWFYRNSLVFTSKKHESWGLTNSDFDEEDYEFINHPNVDEGVGLHPNGDPALNGSSLVTNGNTASGYNGGKKPRKKYGRVIRADSDGLFNIVDERFDECCDFILDSFEDYDESSS